MKMNGSCDEITIVDFGASSPYIDCNIQQLICLARMSIMLNSAYNQH